VRLRSISAKQQVSRGDVLATFEEPQRQAQIDVLQLRLDELAAARRELRQKPLAVDTELTRRLDDVAAEKRHVEGALNSLSIEQARVDRELLQ